MYRQASSSSLVPILYSVDIPCSLWASAFPCEKWAARTSPAPPAKPFSECRNSASTFLSPPPLRGLRPWPAPLIPPLPPPLLLWESLPGRRGYNEATAGWAPRHQSWGPQTSGRSRQGSFRRRMRWRQAHAGEPSAAHAAPFFPPPPVLTILISHPQGASDAPRHPAFPLCIPSTCMLGPLVSLDRERAGARTVTSWPVACSAIAQVPTQGQTMQPDRKCPRISLGPTFLPCQPPDIPAASPSGGPPSRRAPPCHLSDS